MRRLTVKIFLWGCMLVLANLAAPVLSPVHAQAAGAAFDQGVLWRVEKAGAAPSHLFGTVHLADQRVTTLPDAVRRSFDAANSFAMEVAPSPASIATLATRMVYLDGRDLPGVAGEELFRRIVPISAGLGLPAEMARLFKPWAMVLLLQMPQQRAEDVLDFTLHRMAVQQGKSLAYLESADEQVAAFDGMSEQEQLLLLKHAVETHHEVKAQTERVLQAYLQRDLAGMWQISEDEVARRPDLKPLKAVFDQRLLYDRNTRMVERMRPQLNAGEAFIAVGALHLYGDRGVLSLLVRAGYLVTRVY